MKVAEAHCIVIAGELRIDLQQVKSVKSLLDEGSTIPFIARYRKERTGSTKENT